jgi:hypothetical protein
VLILADCFDDERNPAFHITLKDKPQVTACNTALDPV